MGDLQPGAWNATLSASGDTEFDAAAFADQMQGKSLFVVASQSFWFFQGSWTPGVTNAATPGAPGRGSKLPAGAYSFGLNNDSVLKFRDAGSGCTLEGAVTD